MKRLPGSLCVVALLAAPVFAQDGGEAPPSPEEVKKKVVEIERLMKEAERSLARSLDAASAEEKARRAAELLEEKARKSAGKSADELRKLAESGSAEATETLRKLLEETQRECEGAAEGVRKLLEETKASGGEASKGIQWILEKAVQRSGQDPKPSSGDPKDGQQGGKKPEKKDDQPKDDSKKEEPKDREQAKEPPPPSDREPPRNPRFEQWLATLPPDIRRAYESEDWDSVPPKWQELLRIWTKKMAEDLEKERK